MNESWLFQRRTQGQADFSIEVENNYLFGWEKH